MAQHNLSFKIEGMKPTKVYFYQASSDFWTTNVACPSGKVWQFFAYASTVDINYVPITAGPTTDEYGNARGVDNISGWMTAGDSIRVKGTYGTMVTIYEYPAATQGANSFTPEYGY